MLDFKPAEEADWKESLRLTRDAKEQAALWSMIGIKHDPVVGAQEILKLDPKSKLIPLLLGASEPGREHGRPPVRVAA